jgi:hypothetical protein
VTWSQKKSSPKEAFLLFTILAYLFSATFVPDFSVLQSPAEAVLVAAAEGQQPAALSAEATADDCSGEQSVFFSAPAVITAFILPEVQSPAAVFSAFEEELHSASFAAPASTAVPEPPQPAFAVAVAHSVLFSVIFKSPLSDDITEKADIPARATTATIAYIFFITGYFYI